MPWDHQRLAYTPSVSRPMPGPGDLWGSPEDDDRRACELDECAACLHGDECVREECGRYSALTEDIDELVNLAAPYADAPPSNDLALHDDHLHTEDTLPCPWWRHVTRPRWPHAGAISVTTAVRPCTPDDYEELPSKVARYGWLVVERTELGSAHFAHMDRVNYGRTKPTRGVWSRP